jgi:arylsulfatase A-like enzyme
LQDGRRQATLEGGEAWVVIKARDDNPDTRRPGEGTRGYLLGVLLSASAVGAIVTSAVNVAYLAVTADVGRLRDLELAVAVLGKPGRPRPGVYALIASPELGYLLDHPFGLRALGDLAAFLAVAAAATLLLYWAAALLLVPSVALLARLFPPRTPARCWIWERAYPIGVLAAFSAPALLPFVHHWMSGLGAPAMAAGALALAVIACLPLVAWTRGAQRLRSVRGGMIGVLAAVLLLGGATSLALAVRTGPDPRPAAPPRPNILLVSIDSLRADHVHAYGYGPETSPAIDRLAREGVLFRTAVSPTSWTLPAHLSLFTGLTPQQHGVVADDQRLRDDAPLLSEVLWRKGYTTVGFVSAPYLDSAYGFDRGFEHYDDYTIAKRSFADSQRGPTSPALLRLFEDWFAAWKAGGRQRPFFAFVHMWDVHYDYTPPRPFDTWFDPDYTGAVTGEDFETNPAIHPGMAARDLAHVVALYDGEIRYTDLHLGLILDRLRAAGVLDDTIVVVTADHGDEFFEHGRKGHKQALYDESVRVPLVMRFPARIPAGRIVDAQVRLIDVATTIIALAGLPAQPGFGSAGPPEAYAAQDLTRWIDGAPSEVLPALPAFGHLIGDAPVPVASLRTARQKLIVELDGARHEELFDLARDPGEHTDLAQRTPATADTLRQELVAWGEAQRVDRLAEAAPLSEESRERLRQLGYRR